MAQCFFESIERFFQHVPSHPKLKYDFPTRHRLHNWETTRKQQDYLTRSLPYNEGRRIYQASQFLKHKINVLTETAKHLMGQMNHDKQQ